MTLNSAVFAPMPTASVNSVTPVNIGARISRRASFTISNTNTSHPVFPDS